MNNNDENERARNGVSIAVGTDTLLRFIEEIRGKQATNAPKQQASLNKCTPCVLEDDDESLCRWQDAPVCATSTAGEDKKRTVQIKACPSYYVACEVCQDGTKIRLCKGKRGTVYGLMKQIVEEGRRG